jgi:hypothetical protein
MRIEHQPRQQQPETPSHSGGNFTSPPTLLKIALKSDRQALGMTASSSNLFALFLQATGVSPCYLDLLIRPSFVCWSNFGLQTMFLSSGKCRRRKQLTWSSRWWLPRRPGYAHQLRDRQRFLLTPHRPRWRLRRRKQLVRSWWRYQGDHGVLRKLVLPRFC